METNQHVPSSESSKKDAITNALIWAVVNIVIFLLVYYASPTLLANPGFGIVLIAIGIGLAIYFTLDLRKKAGGYWTFRQALGSIFLMFFVQVVISTSFTTVFAKWIEPSYADMMRDASLNATTKMMEAFSSDQEVIDDAIEQAEKSIEKQVNPSLMDFIQGLAITTIFYFIGALVFAAIFKRNLPIFASYADDDNEPVV